MKTPFAVIFSCLMVLFSCTAQIQEGEASYYKDVFEGKTTASGEIFHQNLFTASHRKLDFGTIIKVTNKRNGKSTNVRINDRGPYIRNRIIDVSKSVAQYLGFYNEGITQVSIQVVGFSDENPPSIYTTDPNSQSDEVAFYQGNQQNDNSISYEIVTDTGTENNTELKATSSKDEVGEVTSKPTLQPQTKEAKQSSNTLNPDQTNKQQSNLKTSASNEEKENKLHAEVVDIVKQVAAATKDDKVEKDAKEIKPSQTTQTKQITTSTEDKKTEVVYSAQPEMNPTVFKEKLDAFLARKEIQQQVFDLDANALKSGFYAVQVSSLSDAASAFELGKILADFYQDNVSVVYKSTAVNTLYSVAVGRLQTRSQAEALLEKAKDRYPYAFILNMSN